MFSSSLKTSPCFRNLLGIVSLFILVATPTLGKAEVLILRPNDHLDSKGETASPEKAYDLYQSTFAEVNAVADAYPSVTFLWSGEPPINSHSLILFTHVYSKNFVNDTWGIKFSLDGGNTWSILKEMSSDNSISSVEITENIGTWNDLRLRIDTDSKGKVDGGAIYVYDIFVEATTSDPVNTRLEQSSFRFFEGIGAQDFYALNSGVPGVDEAKSIVIHEDFMYVAGFEPGGWRIEKRHLDSGQLEGEGVRNDCGGEPYAILVSNEGSETFIYIIGDDYSEGDYQWRIEKRDLNLSLVPSFDHDGIVLSNPSENSDTAYAAVIANNYIYITGSDRSNGDSQWRLEARNLADGSFRAEGDAVTLSNPSNDDDIAYAIAADEYYLYIAGYDRSQTVSTGRGKKKTSTSNAQWRIERRQLSDTALLDERVFNPTDNFDAITAIAIDGDSMYLAGFQEEGFFDTAWRIEKWDLNSLSRDESSGFGGNDGDANGTIVINPGYDDRPRAITLDNEYIYIAGFSADIGGGGDTAWRIEKRDKTTGVPDYVIVNDINNEENDRAYGIAIDSGSMYIVGYEQPDLADWRIEKRDLVSGYLLAPLSENNVPADLLVGEEFRLRMLIHVSGDVLNEEHFKLQIEKEMSGVWNDVTTDTDGIVFNPILLSDGTPVMRTEEDPYHETDIIRYQTYEENNPFTNGVSEIWPGEDGLWEFSLQATDVGNYRFRIVKSSDGSELDAYPFYPKVNVN